MGPPSPTRTSPLPSSPKPPVVVPSGDSGAQEVVVEAPRPDPSPAKASRRIGKAPPLPNYDRKNALIYQTFVRKEYDRCEALIQEQMRESHGHCEFAFHALALIQRHRGNMQRSLELFQEAMRLNPTNIENAKQVARSLFLMSRHRAALEVYEQTIRLGLKDWHVVHNQGECYVFLKELEKARQCFLAALTLQSSDQTYMQLAKVHLLENDLPGALQVYSDAIAAFPESTELLTSAGLVHLQLGHASKAFELFGNALTYDARDTKAILAAGSIMQECEDYDVALVKYRVPAVRTPESAEAWNNIGMCYFGKRKLTAAIACLKRAMYFAPFEWMIAFNLGLVHVHASQFASAFQYLSASINLRPDFAHSYMLLGMTLAKLQDVPNAIAAFEKAINLNGSDPTIFLNYSIVLLNAGQNQESAKKHAMYERCLASSARTLDVETRKLAERVATVIHIGAQPS